MSIQIRKTSIKSRKRTLGLAGLGLIVETIVSHPRVDVTAMVNVAMLSRFAAAPVMASLGGLVRTGSPAGSNVATVAAAPAQTASLCGRTRRAAS